VVHQLNADGELDVAALTADDRRAIVVAVEKAFSDIEKEWNEKYGPFEELDLGELGQEALNARLDEVPDSLIWAEVYYDTVSTREPVDGLTLKFKGGAKVPGREWVRGENFLIATNPWTGSPYDHEPVYIFAQCLCPFCEDGEIGDEECDVCWGECNWEIEN
jgi:hypothetical protein